jgi:ferric-dicitrate binding protein FerR (iron transport regulator)
MKMLKQEEIEKIERYIKGLSEGLENAFVESLFSKGENNNYLRHLLEKDWDIMLKDTSLSEVNLIHLLDRIHHIIRKNETLKRQKPMQRFIRIYMKAAASLPLLIAGGLVYSHLGNHSKTATDRQVISTIYAPFGARVSFNLPDGTTGMLNSGSHLSYSLPFTKDRRVKLEGEAWFEVLRDEDHPFEISTGNSTVKVLGTSFNMSAYPVENYVEVVLQEGKVEFLDNIGNKKVTMLPSERLVFQNGSINKSVTDPAKYNAWTEGKLIFRGDLMAEVGRRIERWYNVKVELADKELEKYSFRATFEDDKLEEVLRLLSMTSPIRYQITPRKLLADGTYEKEKVTIYLKK